MILTVTLNAALDVTYHLDRLRPHRSNRVCSVVQRAGGKGVNVSRVLHALGQPTAVTGLAGGPTGEALRSELVSAGLADRLVSIADESRRTVTVVDELAGDATVLLEPGPLVSTGEWGRFLDRLDTLLPAARAVVFSGSLPRGVPADAYAELVLLAHTHGVPAVVDADGPALRSSLAAKPALVKPNADELAAVTGLRDPVRAAHALQGAGAKSVVASLGPDGLVAVTPDGSWQARVPERLFGNPTGAGDAAVAALSVGLVTGASWPDRLAEAVALSAAAVAAPLAGDFDPVVRAGLLPLVEIQPLRSLLCP
ncbi:1-phosphofructokinase family hexose kinase [Kitasatospora sp. NPDC028055]|uniref:1-phosphofructokinase family hexose kinase n=1 Tax=Kitasatospora sp. NPDC028055 TaxID=3155653 RepID=UPI0033D309F2